MNYAADFDNITGLIPDDYPVEMGLEPGPSDYAGIYNNIIFSTDTVRNGTHSIRITVTPDAITKAWLQKNIDPVFGFPSLVRFSWSTSKKILEEHGVDVEW